jgi:tetraacyldisaccharide 4'-kinase
VSGQCQGAWPALQRGGLWTASVGYGSVVLLRNTLYDRGWRRTYHAGVPVVSIGNLTLGGTGKTPCVEYAARFYREHHRKVVILSRGYGTGGGANDEAMVLAENLPDVPHLQGPDRVDLAERAIDEFGADVLVLDDGFQHRRLARDLDVVLLDATQPWGHGYLFPRGFLREAPDALGRADLVVLTRCDQVSSLERGRLREVVKETAPGVALAEAIHRPLELVDSVQARAPLSELDGRPVAAFCGIGNPESFQRTLRALGARVEAFRAFPDHHAYGPLDIGWLERWARRLKSECLVVTTQKDLVKLRLPALGDRKLWALRVGLHLESGQDALDRKLKEALA